VLHKQKPPKNAKNKVALFIAQPNTTTIAISQNKGLTLDFTSSTGTSTLRRGKGAEEGCRKGEGPVGRLNQSLARRFHIGKYSFEWGKITLIKKDKFLYLKNKKKIKKTFHFHYKNIIILWFKFIVPKNDLSKLLSKHF